MNFLIPDKMPDKKPTDVADNNVGKMTDNTIIKALECCTKCNSDCEKCEISDFCEENDSEINKALLDLINRLQAENERLKPFEDKIAEFKSHIRVEDMLVFASSLEEWVEFMQKTKAEAYKECIEKVKIKGVKVGVDEICIFEGTLNNLLKELGCNNES